jgi:hypothetical protein
MGTKAARWGGCLFSGAERYRLEVLLFELQAGQQFNVTCHTGRLALDARALGS